MDRKVFWALVAYTFALLFLYLLCLLVAPFWRSLVWAAVIGIATYPLYERLVRRLGGKEGRAAAVMTVLVFLVFVIPMAGLIVLLAGEAARTYQLLEAATAGGQIPGLDAIAHHPAVAAWTARLESLLAAYGFDLKASLLPAARQAVSSLLAFASNLVKNAFLSLLNLLLMVVVIFFVYRDGRTLERQFWDVMPLDDGHKTALKANLTRVMTAGVVGILGTCVVQGLLGGIGFWIGGLPSPVLFGSLMAIAALVPVVGTALFWLPGGIYLLLAGRTAQGIFLLVWGAVAVGSADNIVRPLLIGGRADMPFSLMALGAIGGFAAFGLVGVVVGPVILSLFLALHGIHKARAVPAGAGPPAGDAGAAGGADA